jgi:hypothetical protein
MGVGWQRRSDGMSNFELQRTSAISCPAPSASAFKGKGAYEMKTAQEPIPFRNLAQTAALSRTVSGATTLRRLLANERGTMNEWSATWITLK